VSGTISAFVQFAIQHSQFIGSSGNGSSGISISTFGVSGGTYIIQSLFSQSTKNTQLHTLNKLGLSKSSYL
jgi:hypothetical protein